MTEVVVAQRNTVLADGFANPLNLPANAEEEDHIKVYGDDVLLTLGVDYTLDGVGDTGNLDAVDGVDATIDDAVILADLYTTFTIEHDPPLEQDTSLASGGALGRAYEAGLDAIVRRLQALGSKVNRSLHLAPGVSDDEISMVLPLPDPGMGLKWNEDGTALVNTLVNPDTGAADVDAIVALVQPTLEANLLATIAAAQAAAAANAAAAAASESAAELAEANAELAEANAEAAQVAAEAAQAAAEAAAGANLPVEDQVMAASAWVGDDINDRFFVVDVSDGDAARYTTWNGMRALLVTYLGTVFSAVGHTHSFASLTSKPTTLAGFGITDAIQADKNAGAVDTYAFCYTTTGGGDDFGDTRAGSQLKPCNSDDVPALGSALSGTWRCMGNTANGTGDQLVTLWYRRA